MSRHSLSSRLTPGQARDLWRDTYPADVIDWFLEMGRYADGNARVSPDVERVLGRPGLTFRRWAQDHAADFR